MKKAEKIIGTICNVLSMIGMVALVAMMCIVFTDVFMRSIIQKTLFLGTTEMAQVCLLCMMTAVPLTIFNNENTKVDVFIARFPRPIRRVVNLVTVSATAVIIGLIGWQMIKSAQYAFAQNLAYTMSRIPYGIVYVVFGISCLVSVLSCIVIIVREWIQEAPKKDSPPELKEAE